MHHSAKVQQQTHRRGQMPGEKKRKPMPFASAAEILATPNKAGRASRDLRCCCFFSRSQLQRPSAASPPSLRESERQIQREKELAKMSFYFSCCDVLFQSCRIFFPLSLSISLSNSSKRRRRKRFSRCGKRTPAELPEPRRAQTSRQWRRWSVYLQQQQRRAASASSPS